MANGLASRLGLTISAAVCGALVLVAPAAPLTLPLPPVLSTLPILLPSPRPPVPPPAAPAGPATPTTGAAPAPPASSAPLTPVTQAVLPTCGSATHPFSQFGDPSAYYAFPNNGFESGVSGWTLAGAAVVPGNEPWHVNGAGSSSLALAPQGAAGSPLVCINLLDPDWRMFARDTNANGPLHAQVVFYGATGNITGVINFTNLPAAKFGSWAPSPTIRSLLALPLLTKYAQLRVASDATRGTWQIDDVFVDPWANRG